MFGMACLDARDQDLVGSDAFLVAGMPLQVAKREPERGELDAGKGHHQPGADRRFA